MIPFTSDGCTGLSQLAYILGYRNTCIRQCCYLHDLAYWAGGPLSYKWAADKDLRLCVEQCTGNGLFRITGRIMQVGVWVLGFVPYKRSVWGYGKVPWVVTRLDSWGFRYISESAGR